MNLDTLRAACLAVASEATAYAPLAHLWRPGTLAEHCGAVAHVVQHYMGGTIQSGRDEAGTRWLWNCLPDGTHVSLGDLEQPPANGRTMPQRATINARHALFLRRVQSALNEVPCTTI